jgi:hypothetical protein
MQSIGPIVAATGGDGVEMRVSCVDHDDFGFDQPKIMNAIGSENLEQDMPISSRDLHKFDCIGKPLHTFPRPALAQRPASSDRDGRHFQMLHAPCAHGGNPGSKISRVCHERL